MDKETFKQLAATAKEVHIDMYPSFENSQEGSYVSFFHYLSSCVDAADEEE